MPVRNRSGDSAKEETNKTIVRPIDVANERYPCCIVWTPIPVITWLLPFVGHMGICDSRGVIHDFAGPYFIGQDCMAFGDPVKYLDVSPYIIKKKDVSGSPSVIGSSDFQDLEEYDEVVAGTTDHFRATQMYNFFCNNCHSFCACVLEANDAGQSWNMVKLAAMVFFFGKYISVGRFLKAHLPFFILVGFIVTMTFSAKSVTSSSSS